MDLVVAECPAGTSAERSSGEQEQQAATGEPSRQEPRHQLRPSAAQPQAGDFWGSQCSRTNCGLYFRVSVELAVEDLTLRQRWTQQSAVACACALGLAVEWAVVVQRPTAAVNCDECCVGMRRLSVGRTGSSSKPTELGPVTTGGMLAMFAMPAWPQMCTMRTAVGGSSCRAA
jgi:hypothetical protein